MKKTLIYFGNPKLRKKSVEVTSITEEVKVLVSEMIEVMDAKKGVGLAAPQLGEHLRIFIIRPEIVLPNNEITLGPVEVFINPRLFDPSKETHTMAEGCLSIPGIHVEVIRPIAISIEALDLNGNKISFRAEGFKARELMHENDHLNGVLFVDRVSDELKKEIEPFLRNFKKRLKPKNGY